MEPSDAGHRPHAIHTGQTPQFQIHRGPENLKVTLDLWGPKENLFANIWNELQANWGESPERVAKDEDLTPEQWKYVEQCFAGKTLPQVLEGIHFWFTIDGVSRACTHQLVRTRVGAAMMQHGGRDNDWRHRNWTMPETIQRAVWDVDGHTDKGKLDTPLYEKVNPIFYYLKKYNKFLLEEAIRDYLQQGHDLYAALVDSGVPWQDARRLLHMGTQTYIHINYNYLAMAGVLANRLEFVMDWEINCVAQLMLREIRRLCPELIWKHLKSHSDKQGKAAFAGLDSWPPDQKYPIEYDPERRTHRKEQMPFWVLSDFSMHGGPVVWIPTNGTYQTQVNEEGIHGRY